MQNGALGHKIAQTRIRRSLTQEELAERAGVSTPLVFKIEQGRHNGSIATVYKLAGALGVPAAFLFEEEGEVEQDHALLLPLRDVFFPVVGRTDNTDERELTLPKLRQRVLDVNIDYNRGRYAKLATDIPALLQAIHHAIGVYENEAKTEAYRLRSQVYEMAARVLILLRDESLACVAVGRAMEAAEIAGDPVLRASAGVTYSWAFRRQRRFRQAEDIATALAAEIEPSITKATPEQFAVWGLLLGMASGAAAHDGRDGDATELLSFARAAAARVGERKMDYERYWALFSPTAVDMLDAGNIFIAGDAAKALHLGRAVRRTEGITLSHWARHLLTMARAMTETRDYAGAIEAMKATRQVAPEWIRNNREAHQAVLRLLDATTVPIHKKTGLDKLAAFMKVEP